MIIRLIKYGVVPVVVVAAVGGMLFGTDLTSYVGTSVKSLRTSVKESIPLNVELQRARDLLEEIVPEMHANVRLIAQEEVEIENLKKDITRCTGALAEDKARIERLGMLLGGGETYFTISDRRYSREAVKHDLARRFERHKEAEVVMAGKQRLLAAREKSLQAAIGMLEKGRGQKALLADRIESLAGQHRLVQAASVGSRVQVDNSKLAKTEKLIRQIKKRLDVAERVLAHEGRFVEPIEVDVIDEADLLSQVDEYFHGRRSAEPGKALAADDTSKPAEPDAALR